MQPSVQSPPPSTRPGVAERIWGSARVEFSRCGYHGARVQGIARGAECNVALMYRHWPSKRALYLDVLRSAWLAAVGEIARLLETEASGPASVAAAYVDGMMRDPTGAQIIVREVLDGAPFLSQLSASDPSVAEPVRRAAAGLESVAAGFDPAFAALAVGGLAALAAASRDAVRPFFPEALPPDAWRRQVVDLLVNGIGRPRGEAIAVRASAGDSAA